MILFINVEYIFTILKVFVVLGKKDTMSGVGP